MISVLHLFVLIVIEVYDFIISVVVDVVIISELLHLLCEFVLNRLICVHIEVFVVVSGWVVIIYVILYGAGEGSGFYDVGAQFLFLGAFDVDVLIEVARFVRVHIGIDIGVVSEFERLFMDISVRSSVSPDHFV